MKSASILILSVLFLYAGVAWALEACLQHDGYSRHAATEHHLDSHGVSSQDNSIDPVVPIFHCTSVNEQVGPGLRVASPEIPRSDKGLALHAAFLPDAAAALLRNDLWLEAFFRQILTFSRPIDVARHLFLSILQI